MRLQTASEAISFSKELEEKAAKYYEDLSQRFSQYADTFSNFAKENRKFQTQIYRAYVNVITDAIEGSYAVNLDSDQFEFDTELSQDASLAEAISKAQEIEGKIIDYYDLAAKQSKSLMADVPRNFEIVARKRRNNRLPKLESIG